MRIASRHLSPSTFSCGSLTFILSIQSLNLPPCFQFAAGLTFSDDPQSIAVGRPVCWFHRILPVRSLAASSRQPLDRAELTSLQRFLFPCFRSRLYLTGGKVGFCALKPTLLVRFATF
ncbi:hypothetical protein CPB86DRAFT_256847 [Serendipita vermifera]|nr:hypothetical protein CPB86DRAFT_256847 [Serendipita vermifera]